jgi:GntR family transcriptional regulator/MocR family aminotransferase
MGRAAEAEAPSQRSEGGHESHRSLGIQLDPASETPLYQQLFDQIVERARTGAFPGGFRLPPTRVLAAELGTHRNTIVRAYTELELAGFVSSTVGRGTFVKPAVAAAANGRASDTALGSEPRGSSAMPWSSLVSERAKSEPFERFRRIGRQVARGEFVNLTRMQPSPDLVPDDLFRRCLDHVLKTHGARAMGYAPDEGVPRLRERIAEDLVRQGVPARAEDVLVTTGSQQALDVVARALVDPGDTILAQEMTYPGALRIFAAAGARVESVPADREGPVVSAIGSRGRIKAMYLQTSHCNPTGACVGEARRRELVRFSRERGVPLVEDDYAADLELDGTPPPPALRALDGEVIYAGTYSKKLIPALRVGFLLSPPSLREHLVALKHTTDLGTSMLLQHALAEFLERGYLVAHLGRVRTEYRSRRDTLVASLDKHLPKSVQFDVPARGVTLWLRLPRELAPEAVFEEARRRGVLVSPGVLYGVDGTSSGVRLTFCYEDESRLAEGGKRLGQAVDALLAKKKAKTPVEGTAVGMV